MAWHGILWWFWVKWIQHSRASHHIALHGIVSPSWVHICLCYNYHIFLMNEYIFPIVHIQCRFYPDVHSISYDFSRRWHNLFSSIFPFSNYDSALIYYLFVHFYGVFPKEANIATTSSGRDCVWLAEGRNGSNTKEWKETPKEKECMLLWTKRP